MLVLLAISNQRKLVAKEREMIVPTDKIRIIALKTIIYKSTNSINLLYSPFKSN